MPMKSPQPFVSPYRNTVSMGKVAQMLSIPRREVRRLVQQGKLPFAEIQGRIRIPASDVKSFKP